jgi:hypothetical protein
MIAVTWNYGKAALAVGVACAALAACSSSASSSSSSAAASATATSAPPTTSAPAATTAAASPGSAAISQADCTIIKQVDSSAITTLTPMQSESASKAAASMASYLTVLNTDEAKLTSAAGKAALGGWISDVKQSETESTATATTTILGGLTALGKACP